jgi:hypothetical protein
MIDGLANEMDDEPALCGMVQPQIFGHGRESERGRAAEEKHRADGWELDQVTPERGGEGAGFPA